MAMTTVDFSARASVRIDTQLLVDDVMRRWPQTVAVFIRRRMKCVGCPFGVFHTIEQACEVHSVELAEFAAALKRSVEEGSSELSSTSLRQEPSADAGRG